MAAPRRFQFIALRNLARGTQQCRSLHMTGPATYASPILTKERPVLDLPRDIPSLRAECKKRKIDFGGNKQELISRIHADELTQSRAFTTAVEQAKRPTVEQKTEATSQPVRHFNTSRTLKAVKDTSTMDFAYMPDFASDNAEASSMMMRVPIMPDNYNPPRTGAHAPVVEETVVMKPQISTMAADSVFLPMADLHDGHAQGVDFHGMAENVAQSMRKMRVPVEEQASMMKQLWNGMVDDVLGLSKQRATA